MAELGGGCEQPRRLFTVLGAAAPDHAEHCEREHRLAIAALGSDPVPLRRLVVVLHDAIAVGIELAQQRHRLGVTELLPHRGCVERGKIIAALISAVGKVRHGSRGRRGGRRYGRCDWLGFGRRNRCHRRVGRTDDARLRARRGFGFGFGRGRSPRGGWRRELIGPRCRRHDELRCWCRRIADWRWGNRRRGNWWRLCVRGSRDGGARECGQDGVEDQARVAHPDASTGARRLAASATASAAPCG
jgi:hypothetical protein